MIYQWQDKKPIFNTPFTGWIADNATIVGEVHLGDNSNIWFGAIIRADNAPVYLGNNSNVQENCVIHTDEGIAVHIGEGVTIGHLAMLHGCTIGDNSLIGIGAVVLNHANIGKNCIIGAKALVTENMQIPDNSLVVGSPAKVIRTLGEEYTKMLKDSALHYVEKSQAFKTQLQQIQLN